MKSLNKLILKEVEESLAEIDIDYMVKEMISKKKTKEILEDHVRQKIAHLFQEKTLLAFRKQERLIDAWADNMLTDLLIKLGVNEG